jgi:hypothetical protein
MKLMGPTDAGPNFVVPGGEKLMDIGKEMRKLHRKNYGDVSLTSLWLLY